MATTVTFNPVAGTPITRQTIITFEITDPTGFADIVVSADFPNLDSSEMIHDGTSFKGFYKSVSTRGSITNGYRYEIIRAGGWPDRPTITISAVDSNGTKTV